MVSDILDKGGAERDVENGDEEYRIDRQADAFRMPCFRDDEFIVL